MIKNQKLRLLNGETTTKCFRLKKAQGKEVQFQHMFLILFIYLHQRKYRNITGIDEFNNLFSYLAYADNICFLSDKE